MNTRFPKVRNTYANRLKYIGMPFTGDIYAFSDLDLISLRMINVCD